MDAVIPQGAQMPILVGDGCKTNCNQGFGYGYGYPGYSQNYGSHCMDAGVGATIDMGLSAINNTNRANDASGASAERAGYANLHAAERAGDRAVNASERSSDKVGSAVNQFGLANLNATDRNGDRNVDATNYAKDRLENSVNQFGLANLEALRSGFCDVRRETSKDHADIRLEMAIDHGTIRQELAKDLGQIKYDIAKEHCDIKHEMSHGFKDVFVQNEKLAAADVLQQTSNFKDLIINACKDTAALQATACANHAEAQKALAECCCELKSLIREQATATQGLVRDIDRERLRDELSNLRAQVLSAGRPGNG